MSELGQLEAKWQEFEKRNVQLIAISLEDKKDAQATQADFPHLLVVSDAERKLADKIRVIHPHSAQDGGDTTAPTTILVDSAGTVRWLFRPSHAFSRLSPSEMLAAIDREMPGK